MIAWAPMGDAERLDPDPAAGAAPADVRRGAGRRGRRPSVALRRAGGARGRPGRPARRAPAAGRRSTTPRASARPTCRDNDALPRHRGRPRHVHASRIDGEVDRAGPGRRAADGPALLPVLMTSLDVGRLAAAARRRPVARPAATRTPAGSRRRSPPVGSSTSRRCADVPARPAARPSGLHRCRRGRAPAAARRRPPIASSTPRCARPHAAQRARPRATSGSRGCSAGRAAVWPVPRLGRARGRRPHLQPVALGLRRRRGRAATPDAGRAVASVHGTMTGPASAAALRLLALDPFDVAALPARPAPPCDRRPRPRGHDGLADAVRPAARRRSREHRRRASTSACRGASLCKLTPCHRISSTASRTRTTPDRPHRTHRARRAQRAAHRHRRPGRLRQDRAGRRAVPRAVATSCASAW